MESSGAVRRIDGWQNWKELVLMKLTELARDHKDIERAVQEMGREIAILATKLQTYGDGGHDHDEKVEEQLRNLRDRLSNVESSLRVSESDTTKNKDSIRKASDTHDSFESKTSASLKSITDRLSKMESDIAVLQVKAGAWGAIAGVVVAGTAILVKLL